MLQAGIQSLHFTRALDHPALKGNIEGADFLFDSLSLGDVDDRGQHLRAARRKDRVQADFDGNLAAVATQRENLAPPARGASLAGIKKLFGMACRRNAKTG